MFTPLPLPHSPHHSDFHGHQDPFHFTSSCNQNPRFSTGKLPKMNFPKFEGENPKLWKSHCENYLEMYVVDPSILVKVSTMHFKGAEV
jgi:hypothetical protein